MTMQNINLGAQANDGSGDNLRTGGEKINQNFQELDTRLITVEQGGTVDLAPLTQRVTDLENDQLTQDSAISGLDDRLTAEESKTVREIPVGGEPGQTLIKNSATDGDVVWQTITLEGAGGTTNVLTNRKFGRYKLFTPADTALPFTTQSLHELETEFYAVRIAIPNLAAVAIPGVKVMVSVGTDFEGGHWATFPNPLGGTWSASQTIELAAQVDANVASMNYTDLFVLKSIPRTDGGTRPMIGIRIEFPAGVQITCPYNDFYGWRAMAEFARDTRPMRASSQQVAGVTTPANYTTTASVDTNTCIPTIEYYTVKSGKQLMFVGDSTVEGSGGTVRAYGSFQRSAMYVSTPENPVEYYNCGLHGLGSAVYQKTIEAHAPDVLPTHLFYYPLSVNDIPVTGGMNDATYANSYNGLAYALAEAKSQKVIPQIVIFGCLPYNTTFKNSGAADSKRVDFNTWLSTFTGVYFLDGYSEVLNGTVVGGQITIAEGKTTDGVHPNDAGFEDLRNQVVAPFIQALI